MVGKIYKYTNLSNGKIYIGKTTNEELRIKAHKVACSNSLFHKAIRKYGFSNFSYEIIESKETDNFEELKTWLKEKEECYIKEYKSYKSEIGYNVYIGDKPSETRDDLSYLFSKKIYQINPADGSIIKKWERRKDIPNYFDKANIALAAECIYNNVKSKHLYKGFIWLYEDDYSVEYANAIIKELEDNSYNLYQYNLQGEIIRKWHSINEAAEELKICTSAIRNVICGLNKTCCNSVWAYKDTDITDKIKYANTNNRGNKIEQYDLKGNYIREWNNAREPTEYYKGNSTSAISNVLNGRAKTAFGYIWKKAHKQPTE